MSGTFVSPELYSEVNKSYNSPLHSQTLSFWIYEVQTVTILRGIWGKFWGEFFFVGASYATGKRGFINAN